MKRLGRWLFNLAAGVSAGLCALVVVAAIRSLFVGDHFVIQSSDNVTLYILSQEGGGIMFGRFEDPFAVTPAAVTGWNHTTAAPDRSWNSWLRLHFRASTAGWSIRVPHWLLILLTALSPLLLWYRRHRKLWKTAMIGKCDVCGYDLRATPDRCPECGAVPGQAKGAVS